MKASQSYYYPYGSMFTWNLKQDEKMNDWQLNSSQLNLKLNPAVPEPNKTSFDVAVVEFNDDGSYVDDRQLEDISTWISMVRKSNCNGAVVVLFIHGWHVNASLDSGHFKSFCEILRSLALREAERYSERGEPLGRRVIGVYFGWNGDPARLSWLRGVPLLKHWSFWDRYETARKIGEDKPFRAAIRMIVTSTKEPLECSTKQFNPNSESPLIMVGHSMGALILEAAFLSLLKDQDKPLVQKSTLNSESCVEIREDANLISFPDLLLALNSAANSKITKEIIDELKNQRLTKTIKVNGINYSPPLLISLTSTEDRDTRDWWRLAQLLGDWEDRPPGHDHSLFTHTFTMDDQEKVTCMRKNAEGIDFGQNWHCLRPPTPPGKPTPTFAIDLPNRSREGIFDRPDHDYVRSQLVPNGNIVDVAQLAWIFQVPGRVVEDHNDIFNFRLSLLVLALIQISGATMSLSKEWQDNFE